MIEAKELPLAMPSATVAYNMEDKHQHAGICNKLNDSRCGSCLLIQIEVGSNQQDENRKQACYDAV